MLQWVECSNPFGDCLLPASERKTTETEKPKQQLTE